jgi:hypothetical protein
MTGYKTFLQTCRLTFRISIISIFLPRNSFEPLYTLINIKNRKIKTLILSTFQEQTCCVTQFQNSCVLITFKAILEHVWITFKARFKNKHACCVTQFHKLQFWSMFGSHFKHIWITFQACLDHISSTLQERTCCVTQFQN